MEMEILQQKTIIFYCIPSIITISHGNALFFPAQPKQMTWLDHSLNDSHACMRHFSSSWTSSTRLLFLCQHSYIFAFGLKFRFSYVLLKYKTIIWQFHDIIYLKDWTFKWIPFGHSGFANTGISGISIFIEFINLLDSNYWLVVFHL